MTHGRFIPKATPEGTEKVTDDSARPASLLGGSSESAERGRRMTKGAVPETGARARRDATRLLGRRGYVPLDFHALRGLLAYWPACSHCRPQGPGFETATRLEEGNPVRYRIAFAPFRGGTRIETSRDVSAPFDQLSKTSRDVSEPFDQLSTE